MHLKNFQEEQREENYWRIKNRRIQVSKPKSPTGSKQHHGLQTTPSIDTSCKISASAQAYQITFLKQPLQLIELAE